MSKCDSTVERLGQPGEDAEPDQDFLHVNVTFRHSFMSIPQLRQHQANVKRRLPDSRAHSYKLMYEAGQATWETTALSDQELAGEGAVKEQYPDPLTPGLGYDSTKKTKGKGVGKGKQSQEHGSVRC